MRTITKELGISLTYPLHDKYPGKDLLFFDIETTGLSASTSYIYLIGCIYLKESTPFLIQWLADGIEEEKELLNNFFHLLEHYQVLIHYNGSGFDVPFLLKKCDRYQLPYNFDQVISLDIYRELTAFKKILPLKSLKQRNVEEFLGLYREDPFSGGDLISVYTQYVGTLRYEQLAAKHSADNYGITKESGLPSLSGSKSEALSYTLLLHNREDLEGLLTISAMISYTDLFQGNFKTIDWEFTDDSLQVQFELSASLPKAIEIERNIGTYYKLPNDYNITVSIHELHGHCNLPYYQGVGKHFFKDYKDYYYLPLEDTAIHKSVAEYVDKDYRQKARKETCYIKKEGHYLPQPEVFIEPEFKFDYKDKLFWYEVSESSSCFSAKDTVLSMENYLKDILHIVCLTAE